MRPQSSGIGPIGLEFGSIWPRMSWALSVLVRVPTLFIRYLKGPFRSGMRPPTPGMDGRWALKLEPGHFNPNVYPFTFEFFPFRLVMDLTYQAWDGLTMGPQTRTGPSQALYGPFHV